MDEAHRETLATPDFEAVLLPHRSLPRWGFWLVIGSLAASLSAVGFGFWALGAWPVAGFCGLEVLLVWGAFELNYRAARAHEIVRLDREALLVTRIDARGQARSWRFEPGWVRVVVERAGEEDSRLLLTSHGRTLRIGRFLSADELGSLAEALREALGRWRGNPGLM